MLRSLLHKKVLVVIAIVLATNTSFAQATFTNTPADTVKDIIELGAKKVIDIKQTATGSDTLLLAWKKISVFLPNQWTAYICDNGTCYNTLQDTGTMAAILQGDYGLLSLHIDASVTPGTAIVRYTIWDVKHPSQIDTLTWIVTAFPTGITNFPEPALKVYSYNKKIYIECSYSCRVNIHDLSGREILSRKITATNDVIDMSSFNNGIYLIYIPEANLKRRIFIGD
ncbi:MAG: T9SS type A sorting domain-containing protein [Bacteroidetes bacterium]|nr:T9SS type A sorting domain-containing protein [Bacteroidota bacterium]